MLIKAGILCIPEYDDDAVSAVRRLLISEVGSVAILQEQRVRMVRNLVEELLRRWSDEEELDLIVTIGGTLPASGPSSREIVPEATLAVAERLLPGLPEAMRSHAATGAPLAWLDRSVAAIRGRTLILNLPAGAGPAAHFLAAVAELLVPIIAHLRENPDAPAIVVPDSQPAGTLPDAAPQRPDEEASGVRQKKELDPAEFAAFLRRRQQG